MRGTPVTWDANNKLTAFGTAMQAGYNADGLRAWKQTAVGRTYTLYDGDQPICELDATGAVTAVNTFGANGLLARHIMGTGGGSVFYPFDQQGSTAQRLDGAGNMLSAHGFDAFGTNLTANAAPADPYAGYGAQWGYQTDSETGLLLLGQRYYDPASGRFLNRDPIGYAGGIGLYGYCGSNPVNAIDPSGLRKSPAECAAMLKDLKDYFWNKFWKEFQKYDPVKDGKGGFPMYGGKRTTKGGHYIELSDFQRGLQNRLAEFYKDCMNRDDFCGGPPKYISDWAWEELPEPIIEDGPSVWDEMDWGDAGRRAGIAVIIAVGVVIVWKQPQIGIVLAPAAGRLIREAFAY